MSSIFSFDLKKRREKFTASLRGTFKLSWSKSTITFWLCEGNKTVREERDNMSSYRITCFHLFYNPGVISLYWLISGAVSRLSLWTESDPRYKLLSCGKDLKRLWNSCNHLKHWESPHKSPCFWLLRATTPACGVCEEQVRSLVRCGALSGRPLTGPFLAACSL